MICISSTIVHMSRVEKTSYYQNISPFLFFRRCQGSATEGVSLHVVSVMFFVVSALLQHIGFDMKKMPDYVLKC